MGTFIRQEFKLSHFSLAYEYPHHFYTSPIKKPKHFYLVWRIFWFLFHFGGVLTIFLSAKTLYLEKLLLFATIWGYLSLLLTTLIDVIFVILFQYIWVSPYQDEQQRNMPWYFKASWFISNFAYSSSLVITLAYWILLFRGKNSYLGLNILEHAMNSVYACLNIFVTNKPIRLLHFWHTIAMIAVYITFLGIYYAAGGVSLNGQRYVYPFLDFDQPKKTAIYVFGITLACLVFHVFFFFLYRTRLWLVRKCQHSHDQSIDDLSSSKRDLEIVA